MKKALPFSCYQPNLPDYILIRKENNSICVTRNDGKRETLKNKLTCSKLLAVAKNTDSQTLSSMSCSFSSCSVSCLVLWRLYTDNTERKGKNAVN